MQPRADRAFLELVGSLPELTAQIVCHEGVHQWLRKCGAPNLEDWPFWYSEGMAEYAAELCLRDPKSASAPIDVDDNLHHVVEASATGTLLGLPRLLHADSSFQTWHALYGHAHGSYRFLAQDGERLTKLHDGIRRLGGRAGDFHAARRAEACAEVLAQVYGPLDALEKRWRDEVKKLAPRWFQHSRSSQVVGDETVCASFLGNSNAILLSTQAPPAGDFSLSCELNVLDASQAELYLGFERRDDPRFFKLALGKGYVTLLAYTDGFWRPQFRKNASVAEDLFAPGKWLPVRASVKKETIRLEVQGKEVLDAPIPPSFDAHARWGVGALSGVVRYRNIVVKKT